MATLLRLGHRIINIDMVCEIEDYDDHIRLFYAVSSSDSAGMQQQAYADIDGIAADALRTWLADHATQLMASQESSADTNLQTTVTNEHARLLQAVTAPNNDREQTSISDSSYYSTTRLQQLHGVGSDTQPATEDTANNGE